MQPPRERLRKYRRRFLWAFAVSTLTLAVAITFLLTWTPRVGNQPPPEPGPPIQRVPPDFPGGGGGGGGGGAGGQPRPHTEAGPEIDVAVLISLVSLATSTTSLVGFMLTSALAWRKERRETKHSEVDLRKKELEIEKLRLEVAAKLA